MQSSPLSLDTVSNCMFTRCLCFCHNKSAKIATQSAAGDNRTLYAQNVHAPQTYVAGKIQPLYR